ncbi:hypothetical protein GUJ93_ZPchr0010g8825 [Zizania palustris]|uniref:BTB domain-containing protein n=1 Tax=Zizania palustris TaxID=103762 RepID=A0A8J5WF18_ZIZPA|nr:hypothetical protein GUJ93_ZPchr0010g8825 [Zizania palustris]
MEWCGTAPSLLSILIRTVAEASGARLISDDGKEIMSHSCVIGIKSPVLRAMLEEAEVQDELVADKISS